MRPALWSNDPMELSAVYDSGREALAALVLDHADRASEPVPACPAWTVHDVLAHVVGLASDATAGTMPEMDLLEQWREPEVAGIRDGMTAGQVARAAHRTVEELTDGWRANMASLGPMLDGSVPFPEPVPAGIGAIMVTDLAVHDQDVRTALGAPRTADGPAAAIALATYGFGVDYRIRQLGLPALALRFGDRERVLGGGPAAATVAAERTELLRVFAGRRSRRQIAALGWTGDPTPYLPVIPAYGERADDLLD